MQALCRDCLTTFETDGRCPACRSPRITRHPELFDLSIAHMDCDAFYASVEKRDNPALRDKPVIIGGGRRGVVSTACYIARIRGVHSAMPMFQALKACPDAVVIRPRMSAYAEVSAGVRDMMKALTPSVEPLSLDEAFLDLGGTERLHGQPPAVSLAALINRMEEELGISGSIGLSHNKFLAKLASDLDKPRGFSVIGQAETSERLAPLPIKKIWGAGKVLQKQLHSAGIVTFADLRAWKLDALIDRFGSMGYRLYYLSRGEDRRDVSPRSPVKSISNETTFFEDTSDQDLLEGRLWRLAVQVADRAKDKSYVGRTVTLKVKTAEFKILSRRETLITPTHLADEIFATAQGLLEGVIRKAPFRLIGVGVSGLEKVADEGFTGNLLNPMAAQRAKTERATDAIRKKFGQDAIIKGRALK